ncbi:MAG: flavin reductase family protein [Porticoccus sp.]|nr:flavin reductase family protein [Porticoccus sp.]MDX2349189.1 flavin reductase family protein [Porticoccus sp.]
MTDNEVRALRNAMGNFATGITVVTAVDEQGEPQGMTANSFSSVSLEPALISWCVGQESRLFELFQHTNHFAVNILHSGQQSISQLFSGPEEDKFDRISWYPGMNGVPLLNDCASVFQCEIEHRYPGGDHTILVGRVLDFSSVPMAPLIFHCGQYQELK